MFQRSVKIFDFLCKGIYDPCPSDEWEKRIVNDAMQPIRAYSKVTRILKRLLFLVCLVIWLVILNTYQKDGSYKPERNFRIPQVIASGMRELAGMNPPGVIYKDRRWAADKEKVSYQPINVTKMDEVMSERSRRVLTKCREVLNASEQARPINSKEFLINEKYKLIWCNIFKSASSSWIYNFMLMAGSTDQEMEKQKASPVEFARKKYKRPIVEELESFLEREDFSSFIVVRDPFERFLSAFRDKIESQVQPYYKPLRCHIQDKYGRGMQLRDCSPSFSEFVDYVIDEHKNGKVPNEHWAPYYTFCSPCQAKYDYILHFEMLNQDESFLIQKIEGLSSVVQPQKLHSSHTEYTTATSFYFRQLSEDQKRNLYSIYKNDFDIFDYDPKIYF